MRIGRELFLGLPALTLATLLSVLALFAGMATNARAQNTDPIFQCTVNASVTPAMRAEGITEKTGDLVLNCIGGDPLAPGAIAPKANIQIFLNTSVTSRVLNTTNSASEALLLIDEPQEAQQKVCPVPASGPNTCNVAGLGAEAQSPYLPPAGVPAAAGTPYNVFQGKQAGSNSIIFWGVPIAPPGTQGGTRVFRITNIRGNANALGVSGANAPPTPMLEVISITPSTTMPINNPQQTIGLVQRGLSSTVTAGSSLQQCVSVNSGSGGSITFTEGFATAFKTRTINTSPATAGADDGPLNQDDPQYSGNFNTESALYNETGVNGWGAGTGGNLAAAGLADFGTRLRISFRGVPAGVSVTVPLQADNGAPGFPASLIVKLVTSANGPYVPAGSGTVALDANGNGDAIYEVVQQLPYAIESVTIPFTVSYAANLGAALPGLGTATVAGSFAPVTVVTSASAVDPAPRFADTATAQPAFSINACPEIGVSAQGPSPTLGFGYTVGGTAPAAQNILVHSTSPASGVAFTASLSSGCNWLSLGATSGTTPAIISASAHPVGLTPGSHACTLTITAPGALGLPGLTNDQAVLPALLSITAPQQSVCTTNSAAPSIVRAEGHAELAGDLIITCSGGTPTAAGQPVAPVDIEVSLNTAITNRMNAAKITDALLLIDEPPAVNQLVCASSPCAINGTGSGAGVYDGSPGRPNIFKGILSGSNSIKFSSVPMDSSSTGARTYRITGLRADANALGAAPANAPPKAISYVVTANGTQVSTPQAVIALIQTGNLFSADSRKSLSQCSANNAMVQGNTPADFQVKFTEGFASAFKQRYRADLSGPAAAAAAETGFYNPSLTGLSVSSLADSGTRLRAVFNNVPPGASIYVTTAPVASTVSQTNASLTHSETGPFSAVAPTAGNYAQIPIRGGTGVAVWEILSSDPNQIESLNFGVVISYTGAISPGVLTVSGSLAPTSTVATATVTDAIPRFADTSAAQPAVTINACSTPISATLSVLTFNYTMGGDLPAPQQIQVTSGYPTTFTATTTRGCDWLALSPTSGSTPAYLTAFANPTGLVTGFYSCGITITGPNVSNGSQIVNATLSVTASTRLSASPASLSFAYRLGSNAPPTQTFAVTSSSPAAAVNFTIASSPDCGWLAMKATSGVTPALITAWVKTAGLTRSTYTCTLTVSAPAANNGPQTVAANLTVSDSPIIRANPSSLIFNSPGTGQQPPAKSIFFFAGGPVGFSATSDKSWMSLSASSAQTPATLGVSVNAAGLAPGTYQGNITINSPAANPASQTLPVTLNVGSAEISGLLAGPDEFTFSFVQGEHQTQSRQVIIAGAGSYRATSDDPWLSITPASGTIDASGSTILSITADPNGLSAGTYTGSVTVSSPQAGTLRRAFATTTVSQNSQSIALSQTGMTFRVAAKQAVAPAQMLYLLKQGSGSLSWTLTPTTLSGGNWLAASSTIGVIGTSPSAVQVRVNAAGLAPGDYSGQLLITADAANSPQIVGVTLTVLDESDLAPLVDPVGLIFTGSSTVPQSIYITNRSANALTFESNAYFAGGQAWFAAQPASGTLNSGQTQQINIQRNFTELPGGAVYSGQLNLGFSDNSAQQVNLALVVPPGAPATAKAQHATLNCTPSSLVPVITSLAGETLMAVGRATPVQIQVVDNCGSTPEAGGYMQLNFNNGDPAVELLSLPGGLWTGTVTPRNSASGSFEISIHGQIGAAMTLPYKLAVNFDGPSTQPVLLPHGLSSAASYAPHAPMAPGSLINIYGSALADHSGQFSGLPLPTAIAGTQVLLGGKALPLMSVSPDRIIAQAPYEINVNTAQQLVVRRGLNQSAPETRPIAAAQPAVFTVNQQGTGQAVATIGNTAVLADARHPAKAGDTIILYCSGLGAVDPHAPEGSAAPSNPLSQTQTPQVLIAGKSARVSFSGLTPGFAGLYQVNVVVPEGIASGNEIPIVLIMAGQTSPTVTMAVR